MYPLKLTCLFGFKAASAALFGLLLLIAFALTAPMGSREYYGFFRYDYLLFYAVIIQICLIYLKLESWAEVRVIALFHLMAMVMEIFLTHPAIASWQYPQPAVFRLWTVPLFAGFMYSAVGSFCTFATLVLGIFHKVAYIWPDDRFGGVVLFEFHDQIFCARYPLRSFCGQCGHVLENAFKLSARSKTV